MIGVDGYQGRMNVTVSGVMVEGTDWFYIGPVFPVPDGGTEYRLVIWKHLLRCL